jgi:hypothetical protein
MALKAAPKQTQQFAPEPPAPKRICTTVGCEQVAAAWSAMCEACEDRERVARAEASCRAKGLNTTAERIAYCRKLLRARLFTAKPSFEAWAEPMTQSTVDLLLLHNGRDDERVLARLRALGALDEQNRLVPHEKRAELRAAHEARVRAERERVDAMLKAQGIVRREVDTEAKA